MTIVTDYDRKRSREFKWMLAGSIVFGIASVLWFFYSKVNRSDVWYIDMPIFVVLLLVFAICTWRVDSLASCSSYCPDEPMPKD